MPSGTIYGSFSGKSTSIARPYVSWSYTQNTATNQSTISATLYFVRYDGYRTYDNDGKSFTLTIDGTNTTQTQPFSMGPNGASDAIISASKIVTHDDDGDKRIYISASGNTGLVGSISLSGYIDLATIPRASDFTAFTLSNTVLNTSTATTINYTLGRKSSSFSQAMTLKLGSKVIASWNTTGTGALTRTLSATEVNTIISSTPNAVSGTLTLVMQTKSGSTNIGSPKSINEGFSLNTAISPTASGLSVAIAGTGRDKTINMYVQSISKVTASFTRTAGYGATISSSTITVKRQSDGANSQIIGSNSGTTSNAVGLSGVYSITGTVKDSRNRTASVSTTITVQAYAAPKVTTFTTVRSSPTTSVKATVNTSWTTLGTSNPTSISIVGVSNTGTSQTLYTLTNSTAGSVNTTQTYTSQADSSSYTYTMTVTDSFGNKATAVSKVGTSFVEMSVAKGKGLGVGKVHEKGVLDVGGDMYLKDTRFEILADGSIRVHTVGSGWFDFGAKSVNYAHFYTDRPAFYYNKGMVVAGGDVSITAGDLTIANQPFVRASTGTAQSIPPDSWTRLTVAGAGASLNLGGGSWSSGIYTVPSSGVYLIQAYATGNTVADVSYYLAAHVNGVLSNHHRMEHRQAAGIYDGLLIGVTFVDAKSGDTIDVRAYQSGSTNWSVTQQALGMYKIH